MTETTTPRVRRDGDLDVPEGLPRGIDLGRINHRDEAIAQFGRPYVEELTDHALLGDDLAYRVMLDFRSGAVKGGFAMFEKALDHGIESVPDAPQSMVDLFAELDRVPEWVDWDQLHRGALAFWRAGLIVPPVLAWSSIAVGFSMFSSTRPVLFSGRLQDPDRVGDRLIESFRYIVAAYTPGGMRRDQPGFRLTAKVRMIHAAVRYGLSRSDAWDWAAWGVPINNLDSMHTQAGQFGVGFIDCVQKSGIRFSPQELEDIIALSRYVGYIIGVPEDLLHTDYADARKKATLHKLIEQPADEYCRTTIHSILRFSIENPPGDVEVLPGPIAKFMTTERRIKLAHGMLAGWHPASLMEQIGIEKTPWWKVLPAVRPLLMAYDRLSRRLPHDDEKATAAILARFNAAIALSDAEDTSREVASADEVGRDVEANKGGMPVVARR